MNNYILEKITLKAQLLYGQQYGDTFDFSTIQIAEEQKDVDGIVYYIIDEDQNIELPLFLDQKEIEMSIEEFSALVEKKLNAEPEPDPIESLQQKLERFLNENS